MRIPNDRPAGLLRLPYHQPDKCERELLDALANASEHSREQAFMDHASYLANMWMPRHRSAQLSSPGCRSARTRRARRQERELEAGLSMAVAATYRTG